MGYHMVIKSEKKEILYEDERKFIGYKDGLENARSIRYLFNLCDEEFIDVDTFAETCVFCTELVKMSIKQLYEFLKNYDEDLKKWGQDRTVTDKVKIPPGISHVIVGWD